jgi:hypothetical protein
MFRDLGLVAEFAAGLFFSVGDMRTGPDVVPGGRGSTGPAVLHLGVTGRAGQPGVWSPSRVRPAVMTVAQGHRAARRRRSRRPPRTIRPAAANSRSRSRLGSQRRSGPVSASSVYRRSGPGQGDDLASHLVLGEAVQREVPQAGVLRAADPVLAPGPAAVAQFQVCELPAFGVLVAKHVNR